MTTRIRSGLLAALAAAVAGGAAGPDPASDWVAVDYGALVDRREITSSGEPVGLVLDRLATSAPADPGTSPSVELRILDRHLEPFAFVLADALAAAGSDFPDAAFEVGSLWDRGEAQPAWAALLRDRSLVVESDGAGRIRVFVPGRAAGRVEEVCAEAGDDAWPVVRHVLRALRTDGEPAPRVEMHVYDHDPGRTTFRLTAKPCPARERDPVPAGRAPLDLAAWQAFLDSGRRVEGARLEPDGSVRWFSSAVEGGHSILGRAVRLDDLAVAYRAVARGGRAEPFLSLDRGPAPQTALVNYGGRLRDTELGWVSLLADIRFKTFSVGLDVLRGRDVRPEVRDAVPSFRTHLERFASDPASREIFGHQTRLWFYPEDVELLLSDAGDVLALGRVRLTAASERFEGLAPGSAAGVEAPWTRRTIDAINEDYDRLARVFPELADLDETARWLSVFTWLREAERRGRPVPDLDALLALELPAAPTPRTFPQLLTRDVLPLPGRSGEVDVIDRSPIGEAFDALEPVGGRPLPARTGLGRALALLDPSRADHLALLREATTLENPGEAVADFVAYRAKRLALYQRVLLASTAGGPESGADAPDTRPFVVAIGGIDLGMERALVRAASSTRRLGLSGAAVDASPPRAPGAASAARAVPREGAPAESGPLPGVRVPEGRVAVEAGRSERDGVEVAWTRVVTGADGPDASARAVERDGRGGLVAIERFERGRSLRYRLVRSARGWSAVAAEAPVDDGATSPAPGGALPPGVATLRVVAGDGPAAQEEPTVRLAMRRGPDGAERVADVPRVLLWRLLLGRESDLDPSRPLPGLGSPADLLGEGRHVLVLDDLPKGPPWTAPRAVRPGEEDPVRLARAVRDWWRGGGDGGSAAVGTDGERSLRRWREAPRVGRSAVLLTPPDAFPAVWSGLPRRLAAAWGLRVSEEPSARRSADLVVLVSAEAPGPLSRRLRALSADPALRGKLLAVYALAASVRPDLPASLLAEGGLAAFGLAELPPTAAATLEVELSTVSAAIESAGRDGGRAEELPGRLLWYY